MSLWDVLTLILSLDGFLVTVFAFVLTNAEPGSAMGLQFKAALADERVWRDVHQRAGMRLQWLGVAVLVGGVALIFSPVDDLVAFLLHLALQVAALGWILLEAQRFAERRLAAYQVADLAAGSASAE